MASMGRRRLARERLALLASVRDRIAEHIDRPPTKTPRKVSYLAVVDEYLATKSLSQTARAFGITREMVHIIVYRAVRMAEDFVAPERIGKSRRNRALKALGMKG